MPTALFNVDVPQGEACGGFIDFLVRVKDGKIVEAWNNFDFQSMFQQLAAGVS